MEESRGEDRGERRGRRGRRRGRGGWRGQLSFSSLTCQIDLSSLAPGIFSPIRGPSSLIREFHLNFCWGKVSWLFSQ